MPTKGTKPFRSLVFLKTLRHQMLTLFLPLTLVLCVLVSIVFVTQRQGQIIRIKERLNTLHDTVTEALNTSHWIGANLANKRNIIPSLLADDAKMQEELMRVLDSYRASNALYTEVIAYYKQMAYNLFTAQGSIDIGQLSPFFVLESDVDTYQAILEDIARSSLLAAAYGLYDSGQLSASFFKKDDLLYITPIYVSSSNVRYMTLLTVIDRGRLNYLAQQETKAWTGAIFLYNAGGRLVYQSVAGGPKALSTAFASKIPDGTEMEGFTVFTDGAENGIRFVFAADTAALRMQQLSGILPVAVSAGIGILLSLLLCFFLSLRAYWPVLRLNRMLREGGENTAQAEALYELILGEDNAIGRQIEQLTATMRIAIVKRVLDGGVTGKADIEKLVSDAHIGLNGPLYMALCVHLGRLVGRESRYQLALALYKELGWPYGIMPVTSEEDENALIFVASLPAGLGTEQYRDLLISLLRAALTDYDIEADIGVSHIKQDVSELRDAYLEAQSTLLRGIGQEAAAPLTETAREDEPDAVRFALDTARDALARQAVPEALFAVHDWFNAYEAMDGTKASQKPMLHMLDALFGTMVDKGLLSKHRAAMLLSRCLSLHSLEELEDKLVGIIEALPAAPREETEDEVRTYRRMREYIDQYAYDPLFSMTMMAEDFGMPVFTFSRLFKRHFGQTFVVYISQRRIERAKELLGSTDLKLKEIVEAIGYVDVSNFIRKFRMISGVTPGEYRRQHSPDSQHDEDARNTEKE